MYAIRYVGRTAITRNVRPLTLKPKLYLYDLLWTCWCAVLNLVLYKMASADDLGVALLACSSVYVASAAIGLVLGLVLNLGLGRLCRKVGSIAPLYALHGGSFITLRFHFQ